MLRFAVAIIAIGLCYSSVASRARVLEEFSTDGHTLRCGRGATSLVRTLVTSIRWACN